MSDKLVTPVRVGTVDTGSLGPEMFPMDAWEFELPSNSEPGVRVKSPWRFQAPIKANLISSANYTVLDNDFYSHLLVTTAASDRTITLPTAADNKGRVLTIGKADSGAGEVIIDGEGSETINGYATVRAGLQYQEVSIISTGTEWMVISGPIAPVAGEPSTGTRHKHRALLLNTDPANTNVQTLNLITVDATLPVGIKWIEGEIRATGVSVGELFMVTDSAGNDYCAVQIQVTTKQNYGHLSAPVDASGNIYWKVDNADVSNAIILMTSYEM